MLYSRRRIPKKIIRRILLYSRRRISKKIIMRRMIPEEIVIER